MRPLDSRFSPLDYIAAKKRLCPFCFTSHAEAQLHGRPPNMVRPQPRCEHLWTEWEFMEITDDPANDDVEPFLFIRQCELCSKFTTTYGSHPPNEPDDLDISWCDLDRTTPES
jgi:hypothetical protein